ncbi:vacuolar protein sorting-associated protein 33B isoform X2 [Heteronotia binoei]|uniref:vacuolar protein sorting-associated protein 33B isoform X2 n=1 Tax=Heteronotia binoei TaxID=13085 RepID=UPI00293029A1|nr:vacuolar protein sorting-associated protein 33B isoform X2 [Heteronotia binoei]
MASPGHRDAPELPDFGLLKRLARDELVYLLEQLPGKKDLFLEADLMSPLDRIANVSLLKQHEVDKLYRVETRPALSTSDQLCFLVRPRIRSVKYVADIVNADKAAGRIRKYKIIFTPQKFYKCEMVLEEEGIYGDVTWDEWSFYLLPLDDDIISMELPEFFRDYFLEGNQCWISTVAQALQLMSSLFGPLSRTYGIGRCAKMVHEIWREVAEESEGDSLGRKPEIGQVFLLDRDVDYVTALCSQVVYEGLVDDTFRIKCGSVDFGPDVTSSERSIKVLLNAQDKVFCKIRNEHFSGVFGFLSQKARNLQAQYDRRRGMDIKQMKNFVSQELKGLKQEHRLLSLHIGACESIMKKKTKQDFQELLKTEHALLEGFDVRESICFIEEHIDRQVSPIESLRLLCLLSITENGLAPKDYRSLKTQYLQSYGPEHLLTFHNLKRMGLLTEQVPGETLTAVESKVSKLVTDRAADPACGRRVRPESAPGHGLRLQRSLHAPELQAGGAGAGAEELAGPGGGGASAERERVCGHRQVHRSRGELLGVAAHHPGGLLRGLHLLGNLGPALPGQRKRAQVRVPDHGHHEQCAPAGSHDGEQNMKEGARGLIFLPRGAALPVTPCP